MPRRERASRSGSESAKREAENLDARGQKFKLLSVTGDSFQFVNGSSSRTATIVYQPIPGQAEPSTRDETVVSVIIAAASAILLPMSHISWMCG